MTPDLWVFLHTIFLKNEAQINKNNYATMPFMSKQVNLPKIGSILQKIKIDPKCYIHPFCTKAFNCSTCGFDIVFQLNSHKVYLVSITKIVEIMYPIYQGLSKRHLCKEYVGRKVNNAPGVNLGWNFAFACIPSISPRVITWLIQSKTSTWSAVHLW